MHSCLKLKIGYYETDLITLGVALLSLDSEPTAIWGSNCGGAVSAVDKDVSRDLKTQIHHYITLLDVIKKPYNEHENTPIGKQY